MPVQDIVEIVHGADAVPLLKEKEREYAEVICNGKGCNAVVSVAPWFAPFGGYCVECREFEKDEARENDFQDKINEARAEVME